MVINTILLDLSVDPQKIVEKNGFKTTIQQVLSKFIPELKEVHTSNFKGGGYLSTYTAVRDSFITIRAFPKGLVSINIEYLLEEGYEPLLTFETVRQLEAALTENSGSVRSHKYPTLKRGLKFQRYFWTSDERFIEYDTDATVFEEQSPYQLVKIVHSKSQGYILTIDGDQMVSERDCPIFMDTIMQRGKEDYTGKEIVILGGGGGGLLNALLKERPKFVTMLELDEVVIRACRQHLRANCGNCLDQLEGPNYKIIIDDCNKSLDKMIADGKKVDYVFGDLTDFPVSTTAEAEGTWDFLRLVLNKATRVLNPTGKIMTHGVGAIRHDRIALYESLLRNLNVPVEFTKTVEFMLSFMEDWVFYQVWLKQDK